MSLLVKKILKISLCHTHTHTHTHTHLLELINIFNKVARFKLYTHKSVAFLYTSNEQSEKEIYRKASLFTIARTKVFYREGKRLVYWKLQSIAERNWDLNKWKHSLCSWIWRFNTVKTTILPKVIYSFDAILIKILLSLFEAIGKNPS